MRAIQDTCQYTIRSVDVEMLRRSLVNRAPNSVENIVFLAAPLIASRAGVTSQLDAVT